VPLLQLLFTPCLLVSLVPADELGSISGTVRNGSTGGTPVTAAEVILQMFHGGEFVPLAETTSDEHGNFSFNRLPLNDGGLFLTGAKHDEVFYPGPRIPLDPKQPNGEASIRVFDAITEPCPLIAQEHEIFIRTEYNLLSVSETIRVSNPGPTTYVGGAGGKRPVTLRLGIPSNFEKVTFQKEFFGRRFDLIDGVLMTTIPWPPGERELVFTYILPFEARRQVWERSIDLPCSSVRVRVVSPTPQKIACNLPAAVAPSDGELVFQSSGQTLPAGHSIQVDLGRMPVPFSTYGRWGALATLAALVIGTLVVSIVRPRIGRSRQEQLDHSTQRARRIRRAHVQRTPRVRIP